MFINVREGQTAQALDLMALGKKNLSPPTSPSCAKKQTTVPRFRLRPRLGYSQPILNTPTPPPHAFVTLMRLVLSCGALKSQTCVGAGG